MALLPSSCVQAVVAWLGLAVQYRGEPLEDSPRSILGWFFATYWQGSPQECGSGGSGGAEAGDGGCTLCAFPAAAVATHAVFCVAFLVALAVTCSRLAAAALNARLRRRMRLFQAAYSFLMAAGGWVGGCLGPKALRHSKTRLQCAFAGYLMAGTAPTSLQTSSLYACAGLVAMGVSIVQGPFSWLNQACWAAYVATVVLTVSLARTCKACRWFAAALCLFCNGASHQLPLACLTPRPACCGSQVALVEWEVVVWPVADLRSVDKVCGCFRALPQTAVGHGRARQSVALVVCQLAHMAGSVAWHCCALLGL